MARPGQTNADANAMQTSEKLLHVGKNEHNTAKTKRFLIKLLRCALSVSANHGKFVG